jgi:hypothetical protein
MSESTQRCGCCKQVLPVDVFALSQRGRDGFWCRSCRQAYHRGEQAATPHQPMVCRYCGESYIPAQLKARHFYCSRRCKGLARNRARQALIDAAKPDRRCKWCGVEIAKTRRIDAKFCSAECNSKAHRTTRKYRRRRGEDGSKPRHEPLIRFIDIAERDHWRCGICDRRVAADRKHPDPLCASLDHILPVSAGGGDGPENIRLVHLRCNLSRRDGGVVQLRLI